MPAVPWTTDPEKTFLLSRLPDYVAAVGTGQNHRAQQRFFVSLFEDYLVRFPVPQERVAARKEQIKTWMRYRNSSRGRAAGAAGGRGGRGGGEAVHVTRAYRAVEVYQKMFGEEVKTEVQRRETVAKAGEREMTVRLRLMSVSEGEAQTAAESDEEENEQEEREEVRKARAQRMSLWRNTVVEMFAGASVEVKAAVVERMNALNGARAIGVADRDSDEERIPEEYQHAIDQLPAVVNQFLKQVAEHTGWHFTLLGGGPVPKRGGQISTAVICCGTTPGGNDFQASHNDFKRSVAAPFGAYLKRAFPHEERDARALPPNLADVDRDDAETLETLDAPGLLQIDPVESGEPEAPEKPRRTRQKKNAAPRVAAAGPASVPPHSVPAPAPLPTPVPLPTLTRAARLEPLPQTPAASAPEAILDGQPWSSEYTGNDCSDYDDSGTSTFEFGNNTWSDNSGALGEGMSPFGDDFSQFSLGEPGLNDCALPNSFAPMGGASSSAASGVADVLYLPPPQSPYQAREYLPPPSRYLPDVPSFDSAGEDVIPPSRPPMPVARGIHRGFPLNREVGGDPSRWDRYTLPKFSYRPSVLFNAFRSGSASGGRGESREIVNVANPTTVATSLSNVRSTGTGAPATLAFFQIRTTDDAPALPAPAATPALHMESRPMANPPPTRGAPRGRARGRGAKGGRGGRRGGATGGGGEGREAVLATQAEAVLATQAEAVLATQAEAVGALAPQVEGGGVAPLRGAEAAAESARIRAGEAVLRETRSEMLRRSKALAVEKDEKEAEGKRLAALRHNPAGGSDLVVVPRALKATRNLDGSLRPVAKRRGDLSTSTITKSVDRNATQAAEDAEMLGRLTRGIKRKAEDPVKDTKAAPKKRKRTGK
ncbi:hypothetical protein K438DRAFT_1771782 [Mycena galopus ATCC 62051]|nr:hypothetical protein K438DRAFT_1771782 [Mycena galopus ATCC 62051]